jgi:septal ring factor EnvC (AmiA/AmiB activator)
MEDSRKKIDAAIDKCIEEKTFSLEALKAIGELKATAERLASDLDAKAKLVSDQQNTIAELTDDIKGANLYSEKIKAEMGRMRERDDKAREAIAESEKHKAVAEAYRDSMHTIFRPHTVRKTIHDTIPVVHQSGSDGYGNPMSYTSVENKTSDISETHE